MFTAEVLARVVGQSAAEACDTLSGALSREHRIVGSARQERLADNSSSLARYRFHHALVQGYLYEPKDSMARARLHERTAEALEALHGQ